MLGHGTLPSATLAEKTATLASIEVVALRPVRANKLGEGADLNRQDAKIAKAERSRPGDVPAPAANP